VANLFISILFNPYISLTHLIHISYLISHRGMPVAGKLGFEGDARSSTNPKFLTSAEGLDITDVSCGYGHVAFVATDAIVDAGKVGGLPVLDALAVPAVSDSKKKARPESKESKESKDSKPKAGAKKAKK
jgi:hypothetical protein